nr:hypothetical protein [Tanacetum cinerariifolium]
MSSNNAQSAVTYTSISFDSDGLSWVISLMNADEFSEMDPYEEIAQQGQDDDEDLKEDPSEEHEPEDDDEDPEEDPNEEHKPEDEDEDETEPFKEDETTITPPPPRHREASISAPFGYKEAMIRRRDDIPEEDMPPRRRFAFIAPPPGPGHDARTIARAADRTEDVGYVRALQAFERRMMTFIEEVNLRVSYQAQVHRHESKYFYTQLHDAQTDHKDIRLEIYVIRGQRTAYETELHEVHQAYLSSEALVKGKQEKDKIETKPKKNEKHGKARQCRRPITIKKERKMKKIQV